MDLKRLLMVFRLGGVFGRGSEGVGVQAVMRSLADNVPLCVITRVLLIPSAGDAKQTQGESAQTMR